MAAGDGNIDHSSFNMPAVHRDGTVIRVAVRLLVVHDSRNRVAGAMAVFCCAAARRNPSTALDAAGGQENDVNSIARMIGAVLTRRPSQP
jgi:hypothetical protein